MKKIILTVIVSLLSVLCLFSCADEGAGETTDTADTMDTVETTASGDNKPDEPDTKVEYMTSVDEETNGFSVKGQKYYYEYNDEDFLIFDVDNLTDKVQTVEISVTFYDEKGNEVSKEMEYFPDFPAEDTQSFIFRTSERFAGFTYELTAKEYDKEPVFEKLNLAVNNIRIIDITDPVAEKKVPSLCADFSTYVTEEGLISYGYCMNNIVIFDADGNVQSLSKVQHSFGRSDEEKLMFLRTLPKDYDISLDELNAKVILSDIKYTYKNEESPSDADEDDEEIRQDDVIKNYDAEKVFDNGFSIKEKKYTLDGKDILLMYVENHTDINYGITISVTYFDESDELIKKQVQSYDWFCGNYQKYFLFRPGKTFDSYTYEVEFFKAEGTVPRFLINTADVYLGASIITENEEMIWMSEPRLTVDIENQSDLDIMYVYSVVVFDDNGELYDITDTGMPGTSRANSKSEVNPTLYYLSNEHPQYAISLEQVSEKFDGQAKAIMIVMDAETLENYDELYG